MKYIDLLNIDRGLGTILDKELTGTSVQFLHAIMHNQKELSKHLDVFNQTKASIVSSPPEITDEEQEKLRELLETEVDASLKKVDMEDISKVNGITVESIILLSSIINEETDTEA